MGDQTTHIAQFKLPVGASRRSPRPARFDESRPAWAFWLLAAPGPIAFGLAAAIVVPLALAPVGKPWLGLAVLAGAALFWWAVLWLGREVPNPPIVWIIPVAILLVMFLAQPMSARLDFFNVPAMTPSGQRADWSALPLNREAAILATQKLLVVLLLAAPLRQAVWLSRWTARWFKMALLVGASGLLALAVAAAAAPALGSPLDRLGPGPGGTFGRLPPHHAAAALAAVICWLVGSALASGSRWRIDRRDQIPGDWAGALGGPNLPLMVLCSLAALMAAAAGLICTVGANPLLTWHQVGTWAALAGGLGLLLIPRRRLLRWGGLALLVVGLGWAIGQWPRSLIDQSLALGGLRGYSGRAVPPDDCPGILSLLQWRGALGAALLFAALLGAGLGQVRALARAGAGSPWQDTAIGGPDPATPRRTPAERFACGGALAGSWLIVAGWLIGPSQVTGSAAFLALSLWALSLGPMGTFSGRPRVGGFMLCLMVVVIFCYGLLGLAPMAHKPLWFSPGGPHSDKWLHAIWGLYVTLACCLGLAALGRWPAVILGTALSVALAILAEYIQTWWLVGRQFDWLDAGAYAAAGGLVATGLLLAPYPWRFWRRQGPDGAIIQRRGTAAVAKLEEP